MDAIIKAIQQVHEEYKAGMGKGNWGHAGIPGHVGGSAPSGGGASIDATKSKITERAGKLGYSHITFQPIKGGKLQVVAKGPKSKQPQKLNIFISEDGKIVGKDGKELLSYKIEA